MELVRKATQRVERCCVCGIFSQHHRICKRQIAFCRRLLVFLRILRIGIVVQVFLVGLDVELVDLGRRKDGKAVVVGQLSVVTYRVGVYRIFQFTCWYPGITECSHRIVALRHVDDWCREVGLREGSVIRQAQVPVGHRLGFGDIRAVDHGLPGKVGSSLLVVVDNGGYIIRYGREEYCKLAVLRVGFDSDAFHSVRSAVQTVYPRLALHVFRVGLLIAHGIGIADEGARLAVESHIHAARILYRIAGQQRQCGSTDVGIAQTQAYRLVLLLAATRHTTDDYCLCQVSERQTADGVVEVVQALGRVASAVQELVSVLLYEDGMLADAYRDGEFTVLVRGDFLAPFVFYHDVVHAESATLHRIGGVLVRQHALHVEAAIVGEVLWVEAQRLLRHIQRTADGCEAVGTLRGNQRVSRTLAGKRNTAQRVGAQRVGNGKERQLVGRRHLNVVAQTAYDGSVVLVGGVRRLGVVVGPAQGADVFVEWPVCHQSALRSTHIVAVVLNDVGFRQ